MQTATATKETAKKSPTSKRAKGKATAEALSKFKWDLDKGSRLIHEHSTRWGSAIQAPKMQIVPLPYAFVSQDIGPSYFGWMVIRLKPKNKKKWFILYPRMYTINLSKVDRMTNVGLYWSAQSHGVLRDRSGKRRSFYTPGEAIAWTEKVARRRQAHYMTTGQHYLPTKEMRPLKR